MQPVSEYENYLRGRLGLFAKPEPPPGPAPSLFKQFAGEALSAAPLGVPGFRGALPGGGGVTLPDFARAAQIWRGLPRDMSERVPGMARHNWRIREPQEGPTPVDFGAHVEYPDSATTAGIRRSGTFDDSKHARTALRIGFMKQRPNDLAGMDRYEWAVVNQMMRKQMMEEQLARLKAMQPPPEGQ